MQNEVIAEIEALEIAAEDVELNILAFSKPAINGTGYGLIVNPELDVPRSTPGSLEIVREAAEALRIGSIRIQDLESELLELRTRSSETIAHLESVRSDLERDKLNLEKRISDMTLRADRAEVALASLNETIRTSFAPYLKNWKA